MPVRSPGPATPRAAATASEISGPSATPSPPASDNAAPGFGDNGLYNPEAVQPEAQQSGADAEPAFGEPAAIPGLSDQRLLISAGVAALLTLFGGLGWWLRRRRRSRKAIPPRIKAPNLAAGVRQSIAATHEGQASAATGSAVSPDPDHAAPIPLASARIDLKLDVIGASRSLMMFTVEYHLSIANRSERALRDIEISAQLLCARRGPQPDGAAGKQVEPVERIGPHQSRTVSGELQLPLREVAAMRQGSTPLFIPMLVVTLQSAGQPPRTHSFVIGSPSVAGTSKLHPIALDTPPGGIPGLRAQEIRDTRVSQPA